MRFAAASLLSAEQVNTLMGTEGMTAHSPVTAMGGHRNLLPNLNCLGAWQVGESATYGTSWTAVGQVLLRAPENDDWNNLVVQSAVIFPPTLEATEFLSRAADRWSKCTNNHVNITLNGDPLPKWASGDLTETESELTMPFTRVNGDQARACQRACRRRQSCDGRAGLQAGRFRGHPGRRGGAQDQGRDTSVSLCSPSE